MMKQLKKWLAQRKLMRNKNLYDRGYSWVLDAYFIEKKSLCEIDGYIDFIRDTNAFDDGANAATTIIRWFEHYVPIEKKDSLNLFKYQTHKGADCG